MRAKKLIAVLFLLAGACASYAEPITAQHYQLTKSNLELCRMRYRIAARTSGDVAEFLKCRDHALKDANDTYSSAIKDMKKPEAQAALKDYQVAVNTAIAGLVSKDGEDDMRYLRRQQALDEKIDQAWQRLALEL